MFDSNNECSDDEEAKLKKPPTKRNEQQIQKERNKVQLNKIMHLQKAYFKNDQEVMAAEQNILAELQAELEQATSTVRSRFNPESSDQN